MQQPFPNAPSTWTLVPPEDHIDANNKTRLYPPRQDTAESGPLDPSPEDPQISGRRPVGNPQLGRRESPTPMDGRDLLVPTQNPAPSKADASPQTKDKSSLFGRAIRKLKELTRSESISALRKCRYHSQTVERIILSKLT